MADLRDTVYTLMYVEGVAGRTWEDAAEDRDGAVGYFTGQKEKDSRVLEVRYETYETELELTGEKRKAAVAKIRLKSWVRWYPDVMAKECMVFVESDELAWRTVYGPDGEVWFDEERDQDGADGKEPDMKKIVEDGWSEHFLKETAKGGGVLNGI